MVIAVGSTWNKGYVENIKYLFSQYFLFFLRKMY